MQYVYDATGNRLARKITNTSVSPNTTKWQYFINDMVLEDYEVQFFVNEIGRLRVSKDVSFAFTPAPALTIGGNNGMVINGKPAFFDFYITDHLDNTLMVLTEEEHTETHKATMEVADAREKAYEEGMFGKVDANGQPVAGNELIATRTDMPPAWGSHYNDLNNKKASKLNQSNPIGPNAFLKVMAGDVLNLHTDYFYNETPTSSGSIANTVISSLINALMGSSASGGVKDFSSQVQTQLNATGDFTSILNNPTGGGTPPNAHLNWLFFDENFNPVSQGATRVSAAGDNQSITVSNVTVPANGYAFVYLSNSSNIPVYFDEFWVTHRRGRILQENHYYPYGLQIASISSKAAGKMDNMYRYQGAYSEFEDETGWNDFELRTYDAQVGRWTGVDPHDEFASGYVGMGNNPAFLTDPTGGCTILGCTGVHAAVTAAPKHPGALLNSIFKVVDVLAPVMYNYVNEQGHKFQSPNPQSTVGSLIFNDQVYKYTGTSQDVYKETVRIEEPIEAGVGEPGFGESLIPVWGSGRAAINDFQNGRYGWGAFNTAMAVSDVFLVKSIITGVGKGGVKMLGKNYKYWSSARRFYGKEGFAEAGQQLHHWAWPRNGAIKGTGIAWRAKNQMWNLMPMKSQAFHQAVHGVGPNAFNGLERVYYGTPMWFKAGTLGTSGDLINQLR